MRTTPATWDVYKVAKEAIWLGAIEAPDKQAAVEKAAQEFQTEVWAFMRWRGDDPPQGRNHQGRPVA
jgi:hypothetical protein